LSFNFAYELEITHFAKYNCRLINIGALSKYLEDFLPNGSYKFPSGDAQVKPLYFGS